MEFLIEILFLSSQEIIIVLLAIVVLFGAKKLPEIARGLGKGINEFKKAAEDIKAELNNQTSDIVSDINEMKDDIKDDTKEDKKGND